MMRCLGLCLLFVLSVSWVWADSVSRPAPACELRFHNEADARSLSQFKGKVVLVDFWASWCGPCGQSFPHLEALHRQYHDKGLVVIGVNLDEDPQEAAAFVDKHPVGFSLALANNESCAKAFAVQAMPSSYVIDQSGTIRLQQYGFRQGEAESNRALIEQLLVEKH
jgi:thiol-disulfide isomerase/thioredoxin